MKKYISDYKFNSVLIKTFIILILFSMLPWIITNIYIFDKSKEAIEKQAIFTNMNMLGKTSESIGLIIENIDQLTYELSNDSIIINAILDPDMNSINRNSKVIERLRKSVASHKHIKSIYIYASHGEIIYTSNGHYTLNNFYDKEWLDEYKQVFLGSYQLKTRLVPDNLGNMNNCITIIRNLPYDSWSKTGAIVINISEDKIYKAVKGIDEESKGNFFVIDDKGTIISHLDKSKLHTNISKFDYIKKILKNSKGFFTERVNGVNILFTYVTSSYSRWNYDWKFIYTIPIKDLQSEVDTVTKIIFSTTIFYIIISLILSFLIAIKIYDPIENLMNLISDVTYDNRKNKKLKIKNEYDFIGNAYNNVINKNRNMESLLEKVRPLVKEKLFINVIIGKNNNIKEIYERLDFLDINFSKKNFIVIAIQIDEYKFFLNKYNEIERNIYKIKLINIIEKITNEKLMGISIEMESDKIAIIANLFDNITFIQAKDECLKIAAKIQDNVEKNFPFTITIGIGRMYESILNIKLSYREALNALKFKIYQGKNKIIDIDDINNETEELYYYYSEKEKFLINNLKVGDKKNVIIIIDELFNEILENRNISYNYLEQIFIRIVNSIIEFIINMDMTANNIFGERKLYQELANKETIEDIKLWMKGICIKVVDSVNALNENKSKKNIEKIIEYINKNLHKDITLNDIAEALNLSPAYASKFFKKSIGKNYIDYLNSSRIDKAKQLISDTQLTIKEVGFRVGFSSIQNFFRTFKKYEGITPGQYRNNILKNK